MGHSRSWAMPPFDRAHATSYSAIIETMCLSFAVFEIQPVICRKSPILNHPTCIWRPRREWPLWACEASKFESAVPIWFDSTLMGRFENFRICRVCPLLVVCKRLKPLTTLSGTVYRLASSMSDHTHLLFNVFEPLRMLHMPCASHNVWWACQSILLTGITIMCIVRPIQKEKLHFQAVSKQMNRSIYRDRLTALHKVSYTYKPTEGCFCLSMHYYSRCLKIN